MLKLVSAAVIASGVTLPHPDCGWFKNQWLGACPSGGNHEIINHPRTNPTDPAPGAPSGPNPPH